MNWQALLQTAIAFLGVIIASLAIFFIGSGILWVMKRLGL